MATCTNCGGDPDCAHKPELSATIDRQASRIAELEGALGRARIALTFYAMDMQDTAKLHGATRRDYPFGRDSEQECRRVLGEGGAS